MPINALLRFVQGATVGTPGQAMVVTPSTVVTIDNGGVNAGVNSWRISLLDGPPDSAFERVPGEPSVLAQNPNSTTPMAQITPASAATPGCYRIQLQVWSGQNYTGTTDVDIRNIAVVTPNRKGILPPFQDLPLPLPLPKTGAINAKPSEMNFAGQPRGWDGPGPAFSNAYRMLYAYLLALDTPSGGGGDAPVVPEGRIAYGSEESAITSDLGLQFSRPAPNTSVLRVGRTADDTTTFLVFGETFSRIAFYDSDEDLYGTCTASPTGVSIQAAVGHVKVSGWSFPAAQQNATLPTDNAAGVLTNDGSGALTWDEPSGGVSSIVVSVENLPPQLDEDDEPIADHYLINASVYDGADPATTALVIVSTGFLTAATVYMPAAEDTAVGAEVQLLLTGAGSVTFDRLDGTTTIDGVSTLKVEGGANVESVMRGAVTLRCATTDMGPNWISTARRFGYAVEPTDLSSKILGPKDVQTYGGTDATFALVTCRKLLVTTDTNVNLTLSTDAAIGWDTLGAAGSAQLQGIHLGTGQVTFIEDDGVTIIPTTGANKKTRTQYSRWSLTRVAADTWILDGDLEMMEYAVVDLPDPTNMEGRVVYCIDGGLGKPCAALSTGTVWLNGQNGLPVRSSPYDEAGLPLAADYPGKMTFVTDANMGGGALMLSDGTVWQLIAFET